jgi:hypothetical protein
MDEGHGRTYVRVYVLTPLVRNREPRPSHERPKADEEVAMHARWLVAAATAGALLAMPDWAAAGGSWLETEKQYYAPGDEASARGTFGQGQLEGRVEDGPYYAYLVPGYRWFEKPGTIPDYAIPLGPIAIRPATGNYCCWVATLQFIVPDVPPGRYSIDYCNDPCTVNGMGDLIGGSFFVGETEEEARLMGRIERLEFKVDALARTKRELRRTEAALAKAQTRYDQLIGTLRAVRPDEEPTAPEPAKSAGRPASAWAVVVGLIVLVAGAWFRRRLGRPAVPDFVPDELIEAQVPSRQPMTSRGRPAMSMPAPPLTKS